MTDLIAKKHSPRVAGLIRQNCFDGALNHRRVPIYGKARESRREAEALEKAAKAILKNVLFAKKEAANWPELTRWERQGDAAERRVEAANRIRACARSGLDTLDLENLNLTSLPDVFDSLWSVTSLKLSSNKLRNLPRSVVTLPSLSKLSLARNDLVTLPDIIGSLGGLCRLDASENQLTSLPQSVLKLKFLSNLNLYQNRLSTLAIGEDRCLTDLGCLTRLNVAYNELANLPDSVFRRKNGCHIDTDGNPLAEKDALYESLREQIGSHVRRVVGIFRGTEEVQPPRSKITMT